MTQKIIAEALASAMDRHADAGRTALDGPDGPVSYADLRVAIERSAAGILSWGDEPGTPVGILATRGPAAIAMFFGALFAGACPCPIEPNLSGETLAARMVAVGMTRLVHKPALLPDGSALRDAGIALHDIADGRTV